MQPSLLPTVIDAWGLVSRWLFFFSVFAGLISYAEEATWRKQLLNTRLADLTVVMVFNGLLMGVLLLAAVCVFGAWALASGKKNYRAWAVLGLCYIACIAFIAARK
jgi:hypothetical protein